MREVKLYGALIGVTVIVASVAFCQAFISKSEPAQPLQAPQEDTAKEEQVQSTQPPQTDDERCAIEAATCWVEALFSTAAPAQDYLDRLCDLSQSGFAEEIRDCFGYRTAVGGESELLAEARAAIDYGYSNAIEISRPLINIEGSQAGFSCTVLAHYPEEDCEFEVCAYLVLENGAWKVADAFRRYL